MEKGTSQVPVTITSLTSFKRIWLLSNKLRHFLTLPVMLILLSLNYIFLFCFCLSVYYQAQVFNMTKIVSLFPLLSITHTFLPICRCFKVNIIILLTIFFLDLFVSLHGHIINFLIDCPLTQYFQYEITVITKDGVRIEPPTSATTDWSIAHMVE